jgi:hypothetical protein
MAGDLYGARAGEFSNPAGAEVSIDGGVMKVVTATNVELKRNENHSFVFHKDGYQDSSATVTSGTSGWVWGNLLAGGIVGGVVDFATGAAYKFSDDTLSVNMAPLAQVGAVPHASPAVESDAPQANSAPHLAIKEPSNPNLQPVQNDDWEKQ